MLESLQLSLDGICCDTDIESCLEMASNRNLRELKMEHGLLSSRLGLPRRMCETLVVMHLSYVVIDVTLVTSSFKSLKTLHLLSMTYKDDDRSFRRFLSKCPVLEDLLIEYHPYSQTLTVSVPSLQRLSIIQSPSRCFRLKTPSLKHLKIEWCPTKLCHIQNMPDIVTADVKSLLTNLRKLPGSLTSVKRLSLCLIAPLGKVPRKPTKIFHQLLHLSLCTFYQDWPSYLKWMIEASPKLQTLKIHHDHLDRRYTHLSGENSNIPECSLPHLEIFEWRGYEGTPENRKLASYILTNASGLRKAIISPDLKYADKKKDGILKALMRKEFSLLSRNSNTPCHIKQESAWTITREDVADAHHLGQEEDADVHRYRREDEDPLRGRGRGRIGFERFTQEIEIQIHEGEDIVSTVEMYALNQGCSSMIISRATGIVSELTVEGRGVIHAGQYEIQHLRGIWSEVLLNQHQFLLIVSLRDMNNNTYIHGNSRFLLAANTVTVHIEL
ncbi:unnamed protein product [Microthlaspi erraticum]|uniref:FBD domain-containing protein n=1 Tax=Microthlaspi erraticum TaxID=1685480 RepID=A0A6D2JLV1_9BRAS|nr:unnamed protein product [Microthlaspi erraticum]